MHSSIVSQEVDCELKCLASGLVFLLILRKVPWLLQQLIMASVHYHQCLMVIQNAPLSRFGCFLVQGLAPQVPSTLYLALRAVFESIPPILSVTAETAETAMITLLLYSVCFLPWLLTIQQVSSCCSSSVHFAFQPS